MGKTCAIIVNTLRKSVMNTALNIVLLLFAGYLVYMTLFKDTAIAKLPDQGNLHKATLAAG